MTSAPVRLPPHAPGMRIGLFGGSFDPPHEGHALVSRVALTRLKLDRLWWIVSPGNPLKDANELPSIEARIAAAKKIVRDPRVAFTGFEAEIGARYTADTIDFLHARCPGVRFVWIMGADNFRSFDRWQHWREIARLVPVAVVDRPGSTLTAPSGRAAETLAAYRLDEADAGRLATAVPPAFVFLHGPRSPMSSTALRETSQRVIARPKTA